MSNQETKKKFIENLNFLQQMSIRELHLYKKYQEIQKYRDWHNKASIAKARIWVPDDWNNVIDEIQNINPVIKYIEKSDKINNDLWLMLRVFSSSFEFNKSTGRFLRFLVMTETDQILGIISLSSDIMSLGDRDRWIGWSTPQRHLMLVNTANASTIIPTQPLGYNFLGGKLIASLLTLSEFRKIWKREYNDELVGITTTSLYGPTSMYNGIPWWKTLGQSRGHMNIRPDGPIYEEMKTLIQNSAEFKKEYDNLYYQASQGQKRGLTVTNFKNRVLHMMYKSCGISTGSYRNYTSTGVHFCSLYRNSREYLRQEIGKNDLIDLDITMDDVLSWWKPKAIKRYKKITKQKRIKSDVLFYFDALELTWNEFRQKHLIDNA